MISESLAAFAILLYDQSIRPLLGGRSPKSRGARHQHASDGEASGEELSSVEDPVEVAPAAQLVPTSWWAGGLAASLVLCLAVISPMFSIGAGQVLIAGVLSCLVAVLAVRALGQTDLNPVSGVGKLSQLVFAIVAPGHVVANIVAGALAEAGAMQAGDLLQDLKTGHLLGASPRAQFYGQLLGATASILITVGAYKMYDSAYGIPSAQFAAPVAHVWKDMAMLMKAGPSALPPSSTTYAAAFAAVGATLAALEARCPSAVAHFLPSGMSVGVGMYLTPDFTVPRVLGSLVELIWRRTDPSSHRRSMLVVASGFVLGEGLWSIAALVITLLRK